MVLILIKLKQVKLVKKENSIKKFKINNFEFFYFMVKLVVIIE